MKIGKFHYGNCSEELQSYKYTNQLLQETRDVFASKVDELLEENLQLREEISDLRKLVAQTVEDKINKMDIKPTVIHFTPPPTETLSPPSNGNWQCVSLPQSVIDTFDANLEVGQPKKVESPRLKESKKK